MSTPKLFVYGSLAPSGSNRHILSRLRGRWESAETTGRLVQICRGCDAGYLALTSGSQRVPGWSFSSQQLHALWPILDQFEGQNYCRQLTRIRIRNDDCEAFAYFLRSGPGCPGTRAIRTSKRRPGNARFNYW